VLLKEGAYFRGIRSKNGKMDRLERPTNGLEAEPSYLSG
jgi:hypothetical protein